MSPRIGGHTTSPGRSSIRSAGCVLLASAPSCATALCSSSVGSVQRRASSAPAVTLPAVRANSSESLIPARHEFPSAFSNDAKTGTLHSGGPWKEGNSHSEGQPLPSSLWGGGYPSQTSSHPDFPHAAAFHPADTGLWSSHGLPPPSALTDSWHYGLGAQGGAGYPHVHEMYPHMHPRHPHAHSHTHHVLHHAHSPALDPCFSPLLLPGVRASCSPTSCADGIKTELEPSSIANWPTSFHGSVDICHDTGETR
ncbi:hypothetical protein cypCar_00018475 [Cyprinus carpio]|nr:hypothetical protein cypCar_00018475 [Cyprinus carpio]